MAAVPNTDEQTMLNLHVKFGTPLRVPAQVEFDGLIAGFERPLDKDWIS